MRSGLFGLFVVALVGCVSCVHVVSEPALPFPERPEIKFIRCVPSMVCLTEADANKLLKYTQQLDEFQQERERLLK